MARAAPRHHVHQRGVCCCSDKGPDFQKASCTLDASVKIYSYRVDDVWTSSFRVLENLNRTGKHRTCSVAPSLP